MGFLFFHLKPKTSVGGGGGGGGGGEGGGGLFGGGGGEELQPLGGGGGGGGGVPAVGWGGGGKSSSRRVGGGEEIADAGGGEEIADGGRVGGRRDRRGEGGRGNGGRWTATATARFRLAANGLASFDFSSLLGSVYCDFLRSVNRFHFLVIYRILGFICWKFKNGSRVWIFCQGNKIIFHASLIVV